MIEKLAKKIHEKMNDLTLFLVSLLIPLITSLHGICKGSCTSCGICILVIPSTLILATSSGIKQRLESLTARLRRVT